METNKVIILKKTDGTGELFLNGIKINRILDFSYKKNSAADTTELMLKIDVNEIEEIFK